MTTNPVVTVDDLHTTFHAARGDVRAVSGVSLRLHAGEIVGIVGESGSGKSVLGRTIMGLIGTGSAVSVSGTVDVAGNEIHAMAANQRRRLWGSQIAMVFQDPMTALNPVKRVGRHLTETLRLHGVDGRRAARRRAVELLDEVGIPEPVRRCRQYPHELSGGMRQRVVIALALAGSPKVLIADEPTTALDVTVQEQILELLTSLRDRYRMATLLISHDLGVISSRADRVMVVYSGRVVESAAATTLFRNPSHPYTVGLLGAIPRLSAAPHSTLHTIGGLPPDLAAPPAGCHFEPRCQYSRELCTSESPRLAPSNSSDPDPNGD